MEKMYKAKDGKLFMSEKECVEYEKLLDEKEISRKQMHEMVEKAKVNYENERKEFESAYREYQDKLMEFNKKYGLYHTKITVNELIPTIFWDLMS